MGQLTEFSGLWDNECYLVPIRVTYHYFFNENKYVVCHQHNKYLYGKNTNGRPSKLKDEQIQKVIQKNYSYHTNPGFSLYPGFDGIEEFIFNEFNIQIKPDT